VNTVLPNRHSRRATTRGRAVCLLGALACALLAARAQTNFLAYDPQGNLTSIASAVAAAPTITGQPVNQVISESGSAYFSVVAAGVGPLTYQWLSNGVPIVGAIGDALAVSNLVVPPNLITNGGFEVPVITATYQTMPALSIFGGWTVESGNADLVYTYYQPAAGKQSCDLSGTVAGTIYHDVPTTPGQQYYLHYALAGNAAGAPVIKTNEVWWNGAPLDTNTFVTTGHTVADMGWTNREYLVTAASNTTRVRFVSLAAGAFGPALDAVSLIAVAPPPVQYSVIVSNSSGSVTSVVATVGIDTDANGLPDSWERSNFGSIGQLASADNDGDGVSNLDELLDGTAPADAASFRPRLRLTFTPGGAASVAPVRPNYTLNEMVQLTAIPDPGYAFIGWFGNTTNTNAVLNLTLTNHVSFLAMFGQNLVNGSNHDGTITPSGTNIYVTTANTGDTITVRSGWLSGTSLFQPYLQLIGPNGVTIDTDYQATDAYLSYRTTNAGLFRVLMASAYLGHSGDYRLRLAQVPSAFVVPPGDEGGVLTNGAAHAGVTDVGDEDLWSFTANKDDQIVLRCGKLAGTASYAPFVRLYGGNGALLDSGYDLNDTFVSYRSTNSGTFSVVVGSAYRGHSGTYQLHLAKAPGAFVVPPGDEGGPLTNGGQHDGATTMGDEDIWTVTANSGDTVLLRCAKLTGTASYAPWVRIYGTNGVLLDQGLNASDAFASYRMTYSGTFNVFVGSYNAGHTGTYRLRLAKAPGTYLVPTGDEGGPLLTGVTNDAVTELGDLDLWSVTAFKGVPLSLSCQKLTGTASFAPWLLLYGTDGVQLVSALNASLATINYTPTYSGTFTLVASSYNVGHNGTYRLYGTGYSDGLKVTPTLVGTNVVFTGSGGGSNAQFILMMTTNLAQPVTLWTPIRTNNFSSNGGFNLTNFYDLNLPWQFFQLLVP
jgi:choice-of-anchor C domain-containing protein